MTVVCLKVTNEGTLWKDQNLFTLPFCFENVKFLEKQYSKHFMPFL